MSLPEPVRPLSGHGIAAQGPAASAGAESSFPCGAGTPGPSVTPEGIVLSLLPRGRAHATSIPSLVCASGLSEREVRGALEVLVRVYRIPVVTLPTSPGVYVATTPEELDAGIAHIAAKAGALLRRRRALRLCRERLAYSPTLF